MTERLFIGAVGPKDRAIWGDKVPDLSVSPGEQLQVVSPLDSQNRFLQLWCMKRDDKLVIAPWKGQMRDRASNYFELGRATVLLAPIGDGSPIPSAGFQLVPPEKENDPLRYYVPIDSRQGWPDWHFELTMRGMALFRGVAPEGNALTPATCVILSDPVDQLPGGATKLWLNPLVLSLRDGVPIPGFDDKASDEHLKQAVLDAVAEKQWMLVPRLSIEARRRLIGWQAFFTEAPHSLLRALFCAETSAKSKRPQLKPAPLQDLAALDDIGGTFYNPADDERSWRWAPPVTEKNVDAAETQLRSILLDSLGLSEIADPVPKRIHWND